jgi:hypothetical protein
MHLYPKSKYKIYSMKKIFLSLVFLSLFACQNNPKASNPQIKKTEFNSDSVLYEMKIFEANPLNCKTLTDTTCTVYVKANYPIFKDNIPLNNFIDTLLSYDPTAENLSTIGIEKAAKNFLKSHDVYHHDFPESPAGYAWDQNISVLVQHENLVPFVLTSYTYTGGAHGIESIHYYNWDNNDHRIYKLDNLLINNYKDQLNNIAEKIYRKNEGLTEDETLNGSFENDKFSLNNNFLIGEKGLKFLYNPYEIKSFAEGTTELLIPYSAIQMLIKPDGYLSKYKK